MASLDAVPEDAVRAILSHLQVEDLWELRGCSRTLRRLAEQSRQWLPIIAPPSLSDTMLTLAAHGATLRVTACSRRTSRYEASTACRRASVAKRALTSTPSS